MPARPMMLDEIESKIKGALATDIIAPECCVVTCRKEAEFLFALRYAGGTTDVYGLCFTHMGDVKAKHPHSLGEPKKQGVFLY